MRKLILAAVAAMGITALAMPPGFTGDYNEALERATAENKAVLALFTGSDWCHYCIQLERQYLSKPEFTKTVENDIVLLYVDMPREKSKLDIKAASLNPKLVERYGVPGFPTLLFLDGAGNRLSVAERGDGRISPEEWGRYLVAEAKRLVPPVAVATEAEAATEEADKPLDLTDYDTAKKYIDEYADNVQSDAEFKAHEAQALATIRTQNRFFGSWWAILPPL